MIKRLLKCVREYKVPSILTMLCTLGEVAIEMFIPYRMADLIDKGFANGTLPYIIKLGIILLLYAGIAMTFGILSARFGARAAAGFSKNLRADMYRNVQRFSFSNIDKFTTSSIITRLTTDVSRVQMAYNMLMRMALRLPITMLISLVMTVFISWKIALIFVVAAPILVMALLAISKRVRPVFTRVFRTYDRLNTTVQEDLHGIRVVKSFVREEFEKAKFQETSQSVRDDFVKAERILSWNNPIMTGIMYISMLVMSFLGAYFIIGGERVTVSIMGDVFTTGLLNSVFSYSMSVLMSCMGVSMIFMMVTMTRESLARIYALLEEQPDIMDPKDPVTEVRDGSIEFRNVSFRYSAEAEKNALSNVNLKIPSGATVGIIGGTGSSKSTLVQLIPRLYDVSEGALLVGGVDVRDYRMKELRDAVSMVLQKNQIFFGSIKDNMRWGNPEATDEEIVHACTLAQADSFIREMPEGYDTHIEQGGTNVSGGQKQRLCIARALLKKPKILILDDSTSAVDTETDARIRYAFKNEIPNTTKIIIAQRISSVQDSDMIIVMDEGRIDAVGTHDELVKSNEIYREVFLSQQKGGAENE